MRLSWIDPRPLWQSRNDRIARRFGDPVDEDRRCWVSAARDGGAPFDLRNRRFAEREAISFIVLGDTGEGDHSQYHVVKTLQTCSQGAEFIYICSDVLYPAGDIHEYEQKFYRPYRWFKGPIYAVPGNHDWYDGLQGFMRHFCGIRKEQRPHGEPVGTRTQRLVRRLTWRRAAQPNEGRISKMQALRGAPEQKADQPGPYFALDAGPILLVGLDTGIEAHIDAEQGKWLLDVSKDPKPKILLTGKPLYVNGESKEVDIADGRALIEIVNHPAHRYIAVIGGDIHNYQRYGVKLRDGRVIQHLVSGAGGAYTHATHGIPKITFEGGSEERFRCYPLRGDSLAVYSVLYDNRIRWWRNLGRRGKYVVPPEQAPKIMSERLGIEPTRPDDRKVVVTPEARRAADHILKKRKRVSGSLHHYFSEFLDWDAPPPPLFKSIIRIDVGDKRVDISCFGATGCSEHAAQPRIEDWITGIQDADGSWVWNDRMKELKAQVDPD